MLKAYKFRLYPNDLQEILINKTFGCTRFIYNHFLNVKINEYKENKKTRSTYDYIKELPNMYKEYPWLKEIDSCSLRTSLFDLEDAYKNFYKTSGYPKYKNKYSDKLSYRTSNMTSSYKGVEYNSIKLDLIKKEISLPKLKAIKIRGYRNLDNIGRIINATISKEANRYYVSVLIEEKELPIEDPKGTIVGIDLGIKDLVVTSTGESYENIKTLDKYEKRLKKIQRSLSRKERGSNNYNKIKTKLAIIYRKIKNTRKFYLHKISKELVEENDVIVSETLKIKDMMQNPRLAKQIGDASWYELTR